MDIRKIKKLIQLLEQSEITELELREGEEQVRISRQGRETAAATAAARPAAADAGAAVAPPAAEAGAEADPARHIFRAPMVGTFYAAPAPDEKPFVSLGQKVKKGTVLCIIEAMKVMNHIEADADGVVEKVYAASGDPIEYGEPLFALRK